VSKYRPLETMLGFCAFGNEYTVLAGKPAQPEPPLRRLFTRLILMPLRTADQVKHVQQRTDKLSLISLSVSVAYGIG
jgi:hypothetical protein